MRGFVVWVQMVALTDVKIDRHHPRKRMIQYAVQKPSFVELCAILDAPPSWGMTWRM